MKRWKIAAILCSVWVALVIGLTVHAYATAAPFDVALSGSCPILVNQLIPSIQQKLDSLNHFPIISWIDRKKGERISTFRSWQRAASCTSLQQTARLLLERSQSGTIEPELKIEYINLLKLIIAPLIAIILVVGAAGIFFKRKA